MKDEGYRMKNEGWRMKDKEWRIKDERWRMKDELEKGLGSMNGLKTINNRVQCSLSLYPMLGARLTLQGLMTSILGRRRVQTNTQYYITEL